MFRRKPSIAVTAPIDDADLPPQRRVGRWVLAIVLLVVALLGGIRAWWGWAAERRLNAAVAELRAASGLVVGASPATRKLDDAHNAAAFIRIAAAAAQRDGSEPDIGVGYDFDQVPLPPEAVKSLNRLIGANGDALRAAREARRVGAVWWGDSDDPGDPGDFRIGLSDLNRQMALARLLRHAVLQAHASGDDGEAVERLRDLLFLASAIEQERNYQATLVSGIVIEIVAERLQTICPTLQIGSSNGAASPLQVRSLRDEVLSSQRLSEVLMEHEKARAVTALDWIKLLPARHAEGPPRWAAVLAAQVAGPFYSVQGVRYLRHSAAVLRALQAKDLPSMQSHFPEEVGPPPPTGLFGADWASDSFSPTNDLHTVVLVWKFPTLANLAAAQLAIHWYALEHDDRLPPTLAALVPRYLPAVPTDPFAPAGTPIGYMPMATRPFVYSVWESGRDAIATGRWKVPPNLSYTDMWRQTNLVWFLGPPPSAPSTNPAPGGS